VEEGPEVVLEGEVVLGVEGGLEVTTAVVEGGSVVAPSTLVDVVPAASALTTVRGRSVTLSPAAPTAT
jgi:hypothetical protein